MKKVIRNIYIAIFLLSVTVITGCSSELNENLPAPPTVNVHAEGITTRVSPNFHGKLIKAKNYDMTECQSCHGANFAGSANTANCLTCHTQPQGPYACNTCHGSFGEPFKIYPPQDLSGNSSSDAVGAHAHHLEGLGNGKATVCSDCHTVPTSVKAAGHLDTSAGAEITFGTTSKTSTNVAGTSNYTAALPTVLPSPTFVTTTFNGSPAKGCADTYCHGSFKNGNADNIAVWKAGADGAKCGSCHGDAATGNPMPKTSAQGGSHPAVAQCNACHADVVSISGTTYTIIDKQKHINGKLNVFNQEIDY